MNFVPNGFWQWVSTLKGDDLAGVVVAIVVVSVVPIAIVCTTIYKVHKTLPADDALKRELLDRGLSADEIATVISASLAKRDLRRSGRS